MSLTGFIPPNPVPPPVKAPTFEEELALLLNKHSRENNSSTPDFVLAKYLVSCLEAFEAAEKTRRDWYCGADTWAAPTPNFPHPQ